MKAIINQRFNVDINPDSLELIKECGVNYDLISGGSVQIREQKITLSEFKMNELFQEVFCDINITYSMLGASDFTIIINK